MTENLKIGIIIICRLSSSRFPEKALALINEKTSLIEYIIKNLKNVSLADELILATVKNGRYKELKQICTKNDVHFFAGSEDDVFDRFRSAANCRNLDIAIRINADCPFIPSNLIDFCIEQYLSTDVDYASTVLEESFPLGMHIEVLNVKTINKIAGETLSTQEKEHVTPFVYNNPNRFSLLSIKNVEDYSSVRLTVDFIEDLDFCIEISKVVKMTSKTSLKDLIEAEEITRSETGYIGPKKHQNLRTDSASGFLTKVYWE